jgi:inorganic pyrophosphatase
LQQIISKRFNSYQKSLPTKYFNPLKKIHKTFLKSTYRWLHNFSTYEKATLQQKFIFLNGWLSTAQVSP